MSISKEQREELAELRREMDLSGLGDRPISIAADKLRRLIELERRDADWDASYREQKRSDSPFGW